MRVFNVIFAVTLMLCSSTITAQNDLHLHRRSSEITDDFLTLRLGQNLSCEESFEDGPQSPNTAGTTSSSLIRDSDQEGLVLLSSVADVRTSRNEEGETGVDLPLTSAEKKRRYNRERQRQRRANLTPEQRKKELEIGRKSHHRRLEKMSEAVRVAFDRRKRMLNRMHYYQVVKPRKEARKAMDEQNGDVDTASDMVEEEQSGEKRDAFLANSESTHLVKRGDASASQNTIDEVALHEARPGFTFPFRLEEDDVQHHGGEQVDLELRLASTSATTTAPRKTRIATSRRELTALEYVNHRERLPHFNVPPKSRSLRVTNWRAIPDAEMSSKQRWYASLSPEQKEKYRTRCREQARKRRNAQVAEEVQRRREEFRALRLNRSEEDKRAHGAAYGPARREYCRRYYQEKVKPRRNAMLAASSRYPPLLPPGLPAHANVHHLATELFTSSTSARDSEDKTEETLSDEQSLRKGNEATDRLMKRSSIPSTDDIDSSLGLSLGLASSDILESSNSLPPSAIGIDGSRDDITEKCEMTAYRERLTRMTKEEREAYLVHRRAAERNRMAKWSEEKREAKKIQNHNRRIERREEREMLRNQEFLKLKVGTDENFRERNDNIEGKGAGSSSDAILEMISGTHLNETMMGPKGGKCHRAIRKTKWRPEIPQQLKTYSQLEYEKMTPEQKERHREKNRNYQREKRRLMSEKDQEAFQDYMTHRRSNLPQAFHEHLRCQHRERKRRQAAEYRESLQEVEELEASDLLLSLHRSDMQSHQDQSVENEQSMRIANETIKRHEDHLIKRRMNYRDKRDKMNEEDLLAFRKSRAAAQRLLYHRRKNDESFRLMRQEYRARYQERKRQDLMQPTEVPSEDLLDGLETESQS